MRHLESQVMLKHRESPGEVRLALGRKTQTEAEEKKKKFARFICPQ